MPEPSPPSEAVPVSDALALEKYLAQIRQRHAQPLFITRQLMTREDWDRAGAVEYVRLRGAFRETTPDLAGVLEHRCVAIVGEPGLGKTVLAHSSMLVFADQGVVPVFVSLAGFGGDLRDMLRNQGPTPDFFLRPSGIDGLRRAFVFDGLDEVRSELTGAFLRQFSDLVSRDSESKFVFTCRQAVYEQIRVAVPSVFHDFFPLGFDSDDVLEYARLRGLSNPSAFAEELERLDLWLEASVPFVLATLIDVYAAQDRLESTRSENLQLVVEDLLSKRGRFGIASLRKALQWLGLAMELYSRNELTDDEATRLLADRMLIPSAEAKEMLDELGYTVLLRTSTGVRFQMRSFGEYLAARQLESIPLRQILSYAQFSGTLVLNPTWQNTISYLIEMDPRVRGYFVMRHPEWVLTSSPSVFTAVQKHEVVKRILSDLKSSGRYLLHDSPVNHHRLARLLSTPDLPMLQNELNAPNAPARANALVLLGHLKDLSSLPLALEAASDRNITPGLRRAAFAALALIGSGEPVPRLLAAYDPADPHGDTCLDTAGALITPATLAQVVPALLRTQTILSGAIGRIRDSRSRELVIAVLDYYLEHPEAGCDRRVTGYLGPLWNSLSTYHDDDILVRVGRLLAVWERRQMWGLDRDILSALVASLGGLNERDRVTRVALEELLAEHPTTQIIGHVIGRLCSPEAAQWLMAQNPKAEFVLPIASAADATVREILRPAAAAQVVRQEENLRELVREEEERKLREAVLREERTRSVFTGTDEAAVLGSFVALGPSKWPELSNERRTWLEDVIDRWLKDADALHRVSWTSPLQVNMPGALPVLTVLAAHYGLRVADDRLMIHALLAIDANTISEYHRKQPLSDKAIAEFERLLGDSTLAIGAVTHFIAFAQQARLESASIYDSVRRIAVSPSQSEMNRSWAARHLGESSCPDDLLVGLRREAADAAVQEVALDALTRRQHLPTIMERLGRLFKAKEDDLRSAERPFPETTELNWIGLIRLPKAWGLLKALRKRLLQLALPNLSSLIEATMAGIDKKALIAAMQEQLQDTPEPWREYALHRTAEYERELQFERAHATTFDEVLVRLAQSTATYRAKLLCEGPTDAPVFRTLLKEGNLASVVISAINGWKNVLSPHFDVGPLLDGFQYAVLVLDGDVGRDWTVATHPLKADVQKLIAKLGQAGVQVHVLERYGIENYFSRAALEAVLGRDLGGAFPLDVSRPLSDQIGGYDKALNRNVAERMKVQDFQGTDLAGLIEGIAKRLAEMT